MYRIDPKTCFCSFVVEMLQVLWQEAWIEALVAVESVAPSVLEMWRLALQNSGSECVDAKLKVRRTAFLECTACDGLVQSPCLHGKMEISPKGCVEIRLHLHDALERGCSVAPAERDDFNVFLSTSPAL